MLREYNKITLIGNLVMTPDFRDATATSQERTWFRMAVNRENRKVTEPDFVDVVCWAGLAKIVADHCEKGMQVLVEGSLETRFVKGVKGLVAHVKAEKIKFGSRSKKQGAESPQPLSPQERPRTSNGCDDYSEYQDYLPVDPHEEESTQTGEEEQDQVQTLAAAVATLGPDRVAEILKVRMKAQLEKRSRF